MGIKLAFHILWLLALSIPSRIGRLRFRLKRGLLGSSLVRRVGVVAEWLGLVPLMNEPGGGIMVVGVGESGRRRCWWS